MNVLYSWNYSTRDAEHSIQFQLADIGDQLFHIRMQTNVTHHVTLYQVEYFCKEIKTQCTLIKCACHLC